MGEIIYNKLVRDGIPDIIRADGEEPITRELSLDEYHHELLKKIVEEAKEFLESGGSIEERADLEELLRAYDAAYGVKPEELERIRSEKAAERGTFESRIYLERTITLEK